MIASGGGGIPVIRNKDNTLTGIRAVIDKDASGAKLAELINAEILLILTDVPNAILNYGKPDAENINTVTLTEMNKIAENGDFLAGSMGPKVTACMEFVEKGGKRSIITSLENAFDAVTGTSGTQIVPD